MDRARWNEIKVKLKASLFPTERGSIIKEIESNLYITDEDNVTDDEEEEDDVHYEGYWRERRKPNDVDMLPYPTPLTNDAKVSRKLIRRLKEIEETDNVYPEHAKGWSTCRLCKRKNGTITYTAELDSVEYNWPSGLLHYMEDHNVDPSPKFKKFIRKFV